MKNKTNALVLYSPSSDSSSRPHSLPAPKGKGGKQDLMVYSAPAKGGGKGKDKGKEKEERKKVCGRRGERGGRGEM
jgi:hypothetical protein